MSDWEFAKGIIEKYRLCRRAKEILISPVHDAEGLKEIANTISSSGLKLRLNLQLHKYIWGANARGV